MGEFLWMIFSWICKGVCVLIIISVALFLVSFFRAMVTNGGRKWYYYDHDKPWKCGYWSPMLPSRPPYNEYEWNPDTCRFEHKFTGEPLHPWEKPEVRHNRTSTKEWNAPGYAKPIASAPRMKRKRPEWVRFLFEENIGTLMAKRRQRKWAEQRERERGADTCR